MKKLQISVDKEDESDDGLSSSFVWKFRNFCFISGIDIMYMYFLDIYFDTCDCLFYFMKLINYTVTDYANESWLL